MPTSLNLTYSKIFYPLLFALAGIVFLNLIFFLNIADTTTPIKSYILPSIIGIVAGGVLYYLIQLRKKYLLKEKSSRHFIVYLLGTIFGVALILLMFTINVANEHTQWYNFIPPALVGVGLGILVSNTYLLMLIQKELKAAKRFADSSTKAKSEFLATMSHEIRTPLNGILGLTKLALDTQLTPTQREYLEKSLSSSESLLNVINDILDFSKIEAGKLEFEHRAFNPKDVLYSTRNTFEYLAESKGVSFHVRCDNSELNVIGDPLRLTQILNNLVSNAIKFTSNGFVKLHVKTLEETPDTVTLQFSVQDSGIGMSLDVQNKLFTAFSQADSSISRKFGGTGLGLSITGKLLEMMQSHISIESLEGHGSTFIFAITFNKAAKKADDSASYTDEENYDNIHGHTILVAEDNKTNQLVVRGILENFDIDLDIANNGLEVLSKLKEKHYDLILMDVHMPEMDGLEAARIIRAEISKSLPILALTAATMQSDIDNVLESGMNGHIAKPIDFNMLIKGISQSMAFSVKNQNT